MAVIKNTQMRLIKPAFIGVMGIGILGLVVLLTIRLITGQSLGLKSWISTTLYSAKSLGLSIADSNSITEYNQGNFTNVVFLHHSVGYNMIAQGNVREILSEKGFNFFDHDYNDTGLRDPDGIPLGYSYNVPGDNTDPDGLIKIFTQSEFDAPLNTLSGLLQHEVIAFKSCFPASDIISDEQFDQRKTWYLQMRDKMAQHPDKFFIVVTQPPLNPAQTRPEIAARARAFANWLKSDEYLSGHPNIVTFDLFGYLAQDDSTVPDYNMLRADYREGEDSHPTLAANKVVGPLFANFIANTAQNYRAVYQASVD